jgi:hypothetical protein
MITPARSLLLAVIIFLGWSVMAQANIGENEIQLIARYGKTKVIAGQLVFEHAGLSITVYFDGDHSAMEIFTRNTSDPDKADLSQDEITHILDAASEGKTWNPVQVHSGKPTWIRSDNKLIARLTPNSTGKADDGSVLVIMVNAK